MRMVARELVTSMVTPIRMSFFPAKSSGLLDAKESGFRLDRLESIGKEAQHRSFFRGSITRSSSFRNEQDCIILLLCTCS